MQGGRLSGTIQHIRFDVILSTNFLRCVPGLPDAPFATEEMGELGSESDRMIHLWAWRKDVDVLVTQLRRAVAAHNLERRNQVPFVNHVQPKQPASNCTARICHPEQTLR